MMANEDSSRMTRSSHLGPAKESRLGHNARGDHHEESPLLTHPGDLVVCKKKRKDREKPSVITRSGSSGPVSPPSMSRGGSIRSPVSTPTPRETRASAQQQQVWANQPGSGGSSSGGGGGSGTVGWANPVKRLRTDAGKRRPSIL